MKKSKLFLTLYAVTSIVIINLVGKIMLAEIISLISLPFINFKHLFTKHPTLRPILIGFSILLISQMISDIVNKSIPQDYLRGWALIIFSVISLVFLINYLSKNSNNIIYYLFTLFLIYLFFGESVFNLKDADSNYFKTRFVGFLNPAIMLLSYNFYKKEKQRAAAFTFLIYALICLVFDARSNGLIFLISFLLLYIKTFRIQINRKKIFILSITLSFILYLGYIFYANQVVNQGFGGKNSQTQFSKVHNIYNPFELLLYGRTDFFVLLQAVFEKPIFGHGSWGKDTSGHYAELLSILSGDPLSYELGFIPAHSIFLGIWAYAGILGFLATFYIFYKLFKMSYIIYKSDSYILPIILALSIVMLWAYFFSPIALLRTSFPFFAAIIIIKYEEVQQTKLLNQNIEII